MTSDDKQKSFDEIYCLAKETSKRLREIKKDTTLSKPIELDVLKTEKAMFYENCVAVFKAYKGDR